jgi:hypothetical protein
VLIDLFIVYLFTIGIELINGIGVVTGNYQVADWIVSLSTENALFGLIVMFFTISLWSFIYPELWEVLY